ncbi:TPA: hypothetical protein ACH3X2_012380 [Trebouxia sp. C0005]
MAKAVKSAQSRSIGDTFQATTEQGPVAFKKQFDDVLAMIEAGKEEGARLLTRGLYTYQVVQRANHSVYGLAAGVFTNDLDTANYISRALKVGTVWINSCWFMLSPSVPFGGHK